MKKNSMSFAVLFAMIGIAVSSAFSNAAAQGVAPVNPNFLRWQQAHHKKQLEAPAIKTTSSATRGASTANTLSEDEQSNFGFIPEIVDLSYLANWNSSLECGVAQGYPSRYNLAENGFVTSVKDQGNYGTCWSFATMASLESSILKSGGAAFDFSENNLANLHGWDWGFDDGGNANMASAYLLRWGGPVTESSDSYPRPGRSSALTPAKHVQRVVWIAGKNSYLDNDAIKAAIMKYGALYASLYYSSGYYNSGRSSYCLTVDNPSRLSNHAVTLVGWDDNYSRNNFTSKPSGDGAYIVKNSWGRNWGDNGYFYVSYYDESFAWKTSYAFCGAESTDNYDAVYQYDQLGLVGNCGYGATSWGANMFSATSSSKIAAVGFYAMVPRTSYTIYIYTGCTASQPSSGTLALEQSGTTDEAGYVTIPLANAVAVSSGRRFSVVLRLSTPGYSYPIAYEYAYSGITSAATASAGQSFISQGGSTWADMTEKIHSTANFCCKAYMKNGAAPAKTLSSVSISGANTVAAGKTAQFTCEATYSDGSKQSVTPTWSITSGSSYASVSANGLVTAGIVTEQKTATLQASYTEGNVTKTASWAFYVTVSAPNAPSGLSATAGSEVSCVRLSWDVSAGAASYAVYRSSTASSANAAYLGTTTTVRYSDTTAIPGVNYTYFVKAKNSTGSSAFSASATGWRALAAPTGVTASDGSSLDFVLVSWDASEGASYYRVYRAESFDDTPVALSGWQAARSYSDRTAVPGKTYAYCVVSATDASGTRPSAYSISDEGYRAEPLVMKSLTINGPASLDSGASAAYTCTANYSDGSHIAVTPVWSVSAGSTAVNGGTATVTAPVVSSAQTVTLQASYTDNAGTQKSISRTISVSPVVPSAPGGLTVVSATTESVKINWSAVDNASSYTVWRGTNIGNRGELGTTSATEYTDTSATPGVSYTYWVAAVNGAGASNPSAASVTSARLLSAPTNLSASNGTSADKVALTWRASTGASHYRVYRATSSTASKTALGTWQTTLSFDDTTATPGTTYTYFVRAAVNSSGSMASAYSAPAIGMRKIAPTLLAIEVFGPDSLPSSGTASYTAKARYSNGDETLVTPAWSIASGAGYASIVADGTLTANAVTADQTVVLVATYTERGVTVSENKTVSIIAPVPKTANVTDVMAKARWPWNGFVDVDYTLETAPAGTLAYVTLSGYDLDHNTAMAATTVSGDGAGDTAIAAGAHRITWNVGQDYPSFHAKDFRVTINAVPQVLPPEAPAGLTASDGTSADSVELTWSPSREATAYQVWRATVNNSGSSTRLASVDSTTYSDISAVAGTTYYYWVKAGSATGWSDFSQGDSGYRATAIVAEGDWYVDGTAGSDSNSGRSWAAAKKTIQAAINLASSGEVILVAAGTYAPINSNNKSIIIRSASGASSTFIDGGGTSTCAVLAPEVDNNKNTVLIGFTLQNGYANGEGKAPAALHGIIKNCIIRNNEGHGYGASSGIRDAYVYNSLFYGNTFSYSGIWGGGATTHGAIYNCTIVDNEGYGIWDTRVHNSIVWGNTGDFYISSGFTDCTPQYSCYSSARYDGAGCIKADPQFVDAANHDYRLSSSSPCIGMGLNEYANGIESDLDGNVRIHNGAVDIGAYEYGSIPVTPDDPDNPVDPDEPVVVDGLYMVIDLSGGSAAVNYPVSYLADVPVDGWTDEYKTTKLVLKKIPAGTFIMGEDQTDESHRVTLTKDFYMGVFEVTQKQWELVMGSNPCSSTSYGKGDNYPVHYISYDMIRGSSENAQWKSSSQVDSTSFIGRIQSKTGLKLDLPTEAQWEFSCRAGTTTAYSYGDNVNGAYMWYNNNSGSHSHEVGTCLPNAWGIYDMHGNVWEWCLDASGEQVYGTDPRRPVSLESDRIQRGGSWHASSLYCTSLNRDSISSSSEDYLSGFRLALPVLRRADIGQGLNIAYYDVSGLPYSTWRSSYSAMMAYFSEKTPELVTNSCEIGEFLNFGATSGSDGAPTTVCLFHDKYKNPSTDHFAVLLSGTIYVSEPGIYTFGKLSDDGIALYIDRQLVYGSPVTQDFSYGMYTGNITLSSGVHEFTLAFHENGGGQGLQMYWQTPSMSALELLPQNVLFLDQIDNPSLYSYTIHYDANSGSGTMQDQIANLGTPVTLYANVFTKAGYIFAGWSTSAEGPVYYEDAEIVSSLSSVGNVVVTLYAVWRENNLAAAVNAPALTFTSGGNAEWFVETSDTHDGVAAARSGPIDHNQNTWIETSVVGTGTLSFWWKASTESVTYDWAEILVDGTQKAKIGGLDCDWSHMTLTITGPGTHVLRWNYRKDNIVSKGSDCAWLDQVTWAPDESLVANSITIRSFIDGSDYVKIRGDSVWFEHIYASLPGRHDDGNGNEASYVNGKEWYPTWDCLPYGSDYVDAGALSGIYHLPSGEAILPLTDGLPVALTPISGRGAVTLEATPSADNDFTAVVKIDDDWQCGPCWYEFELSWPTMASSSYTIRYNANGGTGTMSDQTAFIGYSVTVRSCSFIKSGCVFAGWSTSAGGDVTFAAGQSVDCLAQGEGATINLYAVWRGLSVAVNAPALSFTTGGNAEWFVETSESHDGVSAVQSGDINDSQNSWIETSVNGEGTLSFWWKVSSESVSFDWVEILVDGARNQKIGGTGGSWSHVTIQISGAGTHTLRWNYRKDSSVTSGSDCAWLDQVSWTPTGATFSGN